MIDAGYIDISIHALREEGDPGAIYNAKQAKEFLSTPSARRATILGTALHTGIEISIHALREEGDQCNTHIPVLNALFLSTPSARRAT